jgi:hypothetical protein
LPGEAPAGLVVTSPTEGTLSLFHDQGRFRFDFNQRQLLPLPGPGAMPVGVIAVDLTGEGSTPGLSLVVTHQGTNQIEILQPAP